MKRRQFIRTTTAGSIALVTGNYSKLAAPFVADDLYTISRSLSANWATTLLGLQLKTPGTDYGGIRGPGSNHIHGRIGDTIYPFMHMARRTGDVRYIDASAALFRWMEAHVSQPDGSWLNEKNERWKGTTVFTLIALCEALRFHGALMDHSFKSALNNRLLKAGEWINTNVNIDFGNINYPISASYALSLLGTLQDNNRFKEKAKSLAQQATKFFTHNDRFIYGEGTPFYEASKKGCFSVDLGYNVEESLPSLALYGLLNKDEEILQLVTASLQTHMEFMLPDGGWDNSWGTRNYKWTYWGSRTSDGCAPAYALLANRDARFYQVALKNTQLLQQCTANGLLYGGPHYISHQVPPNVHHTFCHLKALTTILDHEHVNRPTAVALLPRETAYGLRFFPDIQTWLVATGPFRATVTGYDREYKAMHNGHATGGALSMLWHQQTGPLLVASMNAYQLVEAGNMQADTDPLSMPLTCRAELTANGVIYMNIAYLDAAINASRQGEKIVIKASSKLVDQDQNDPPLGPVYCETVYTFAPDKIMLSFHCKGNITSYLSDIRIVIPVIATSQERVQQMNDTNVEILKSNARVHLQSHQPLTRLRTTGDRLFNFVPGLEAVPFAINKAVGTVVLTVQ